MAIPKALRWQVWKNFNGRTYDGRCFCCNETLSIESWHCSHIVPRFENGADTSSNLRPCCSGCNNSMGTKNMYAFILKCGMHGVKNLPSEVYEGVEESSGESGSEGLCMQDLRVVHAVLSSSSEEEEELQILVATHESITQRPSNPKRKKSSKRKLKGLLQGQVRVDFRLGDLQITLDVEDSVRVTSLPAEFAKAVSSRGLGVRHTATWITKIDNLEYNEIYSHLKLDFFHKRYLKVKLSEKPNPRRPNKTLDFRCQEFVAYQYNVIRDSVEAFELCKEFFVIENETLLREFNYQQLKFIGRDIFGLPIDGGKNTMIQRIRDYIEVSRVATQSSPSSSSSPFGTGIFLF